MNIQPTKTKILIIATDARLSDLFAAAFDSESFVMLARPSAEEALELVEGFHPHVIVVGFDSTDFSPRDFMMMFQNHPVYRSHRHIPVLFFSDTPLGDAELFTEGLSGWYSYQITSSAIREIIENLLIQEAAQKHQADLVQEVKRSEYRYRDLLENASDLILAIDESAKLTYLNNRFLTLTGFDKSEWINRPFLDMIPQKNRGRIREQFDQVQQGRSRLFEAAILSAYPDSPILSFSLTPLFKRGAVKGAMGIGRDVSEQKRLEKNIHDLENFNESIIQSMESGLLTLDLEGQITSLNQGGEKILGWSVQEIVGKTLVSVFSEDEARMLLSESAQVAPLTLNQESHLTVKSGRQIFVGFNKTDWIDNLGEQVGTLISFRDITQLKQMQSEVLRMDRLASLGVLASGIAHEIKNPLAGIKMMAQACEEEMDASDARKEYLTRIIRQVNRLDDLLKTFFSFAKPGKPNRTVHTLQDIIHEVSQLIQKNLSYREIELVVDIPENLPGILVDSQQMQQVFLNLILNAIDAMPSGGRLTVAATQNPNKGSERPTLLFDSEEGSFVWIGVTDTGHGIPEDKLSHIFDPFFTTKSDGMGLGLSIVYRIIQEHQGEIRVTSHSGKGTTFHLWLPTGEKHE